MSDDLVNLFNPGQQAQTDKPGNEYIRLSDYTNTIGRAEEVQVHFKTVRTICVKAKDIHVKGLESLMILRSYLTYNQKKRETQSHVINWSGALTNWKRRVLSGINDCIENGYIIQTGKTLSITDKGEALIRDFNRTFEEEKQRYFEKAEKTRLRIKNRKRKPKTDLGII